VTVVIGDDEFKAPAGSFAFAPRGIPHAFRIDSPATKLLLLITPGAAGHEELFRAIGEPARRHSVPPPPAAPPDFARLAELAARPPNGDAPACRYTGAGANRMPIRPGRLLDVLLRGQLTASGWRAARQ